jgi:small subunit ribosomal protein S8
MDQISNFLNQLKLAGRAQKEYILVPFSKVKLAIAKTLEKEGYVASVDKAEVKGHPYIKVTLLYKGKEARISDIERVSRPSQRAYSSVKKLRPYKYGKGMTVLTTPKGVMSDTEAKKEMVGGEVLFRIW